jgi:hypothetical protein
MENNTYQTTEQKARQIGDTVNKKAKEIGDTVKEKIEGTDASEWMNAISQLNAPETASSSQAW